MNAVEQIAPVPYPEGKKIDELPRMRSCQSSDHGRTDLGGHEPAHRSCGHGEKRRRDEARLDPELGMLSRSQDEHRRFPDAAEASQPKPTAGTPITKRRGIMTAAIRGIPTSVHGVPRKPLPSPRDSQAERRI